MALTLKSKNGYTRLWRATASPNGPNCPNLTDIRNLVQKAQDEIAFLLYIRDLIIIRIALTFSNSKDAHEARINTTKIKKECTGLRKQYAGLKEECAGLKNENKEIKTQLQIQYKQTIDDRLKRLRRLLQITPNDEIHPRAQLEGNLRWTFEFNKKKVPKFEDSLKPLMKDDLFFLWENSAISSLLVLSGHSSGTMQSQRFCWLSAAAIN
ncbi:MAG: hypothetical protein LQ342_007366 [Letrouitia transgressa]|nr:MAG: hypothetical protein LQ342_007366 [Letrouitia transgressa]